VLKLFAEGSQIQTYDFVRAELKISPQVNWHVLFYSIDTFCFIAFCFICCTRYKGFVERLLWDPWKECLGAARGPQNCGWATLL